MRERVVSLIGALFAALCICIAFPGAAMAEEIDAGTYERDYIQKLYDSDDGVDGSSVNCVFADKDGIIWIGSYSGLYSYDSTEFHQHKIADHTVAIRCITQDRKGRLWFGTNGDGLYSYDGEKIIACYTNFPHQGEWEHIGLHSLAQWQ